MKDNGRKPLLASKIRPDLINLRDGEQRTIVCGDCGRWRAIRRSMVKPHRITMDSNKPKKTGSGVEEYVPRCLGSGQRIQFDITPEQWQARYDKLADRRQDQGMNPGSRHTTRVKRMTTVVAPPAAKVVPSLPTPSSTFEKYDGHRKSCVMCTGRRHCPDGARLARAHVQAVRDEPRMRPVRRAYERLLQDAEQRRSQELPAKRAGEWDAVLPSTRAADARRTQLPDGDAPTDGPGVPLAPQDVDAHDRRQAELGKRYARKTSATSAA
ncbi:hypothetical protein [Streptomyces angustmyceticus]|uniref:hypothetical protein n=1 Tax=Streptomyces angustmyceticus TaxID=285578 RepID=UPI003D91AFA3